MTFNSCYQFNSLFFAQGINASVQMDKINYFDENELVLDDMNYSQDCRTMSGNYVYDNDFSNTYESRENLSQAKKIFTEMGMENIIYIYIYIYMAHQY